MLKRNKAAILLDKGLERADGRDALIEDTQLGREFISCSTRSAIGLCLGVKERLEIILKVPGEHAVGTSAHGTVSRGTHTFLHTRHTTHQNF